MAMRFRDLNTCEPPANLPRLVEGEYTFLWYSGIWDGPTSGMLLYMGNESWFEMFQENEDDKSLDKWYRRFAVLVLTSEQLAREREVHEDFLRHVATHMDPGRPRSIRPKEEHHLFYDKHLDYCQHRNFDENEALAWFER